MVIWETNKMLKSKEGTTNTKSKFKVLVKDKNSSPTTGAKVPLAIQSFVRMTLEVKLIENQKSYDLLHLNQFFIYYYKQV